MINDDYDNVDHSYLSELMWWGGGGVVKELNIVVCCE